MCNEREKKHFKLFMIVITTIIAYAVSYICQSNGVYTIFQNIFYIPILLSCFWFGKKGFKYSVFITTTHFLLFIKYNSGHHLEELVRLFVFIIISLITYKIITRIKDQQAKINHMNKLLINDVERFNKVQSLSHLGNYEINLQTGKTIWSDELFRIFGYEPKSFEPTSEKRIELTHPDDKEFLRNNIKKAIDEKSSFRIENRIVRPDGSIHWILSTGCVEFSEDKKTQSFIGALIDITERKLLEKSLEEEKEQLNVTISSIGDGVISSGVNGKIKILNKVAENLTGWTQEEALGKPTEDVFNIISHGSRLKYEDPIRKVIENRRTIDPKHTLLISKDGTERAISNSASPIKDNDGNIQGTILVFRDLTEEKTRQNELYYMSYYDLLTGLYNRKFFEKEMEKLDTENNLPIAIIMGNVNGLKLTNDAFGHSEGDKLLKKAALTIKNTCRKNDISARWGGDEFTILLPKTEKCEAESIVQRIKNICSNIQIDSIDVSISFGCDAKENINDDILKVLKNAEDYMYKNKVIESDSMRGNIINTILNTLYEKNPREGRHSKRVSELCQQIGLAMELPKIEINKLKVVGLLHDIGKIAIEESILNKPGKLTDKEWDEIRRHPDIGYRILSSSNEMLEIADYVLAHHERFDGLGYPQKLKGEKIPLLSRIIAIADSYDAMTSERSYRKPLDKNTVVNELIKNKGTQFDPQIVNIFIKKVLNNHQRTY
ncbi:HD domain-containing phosphohydrolase [Clostridium akagii]|uniref:HD domain-containing phosphohydrolase n=1 Tax=Clostridium akagii TaxID=91623 RepID=UPI00068BB578|nr:HD domain-containing phosphohydrolase [Clostridium akagii]